MWTGSTQVLSDKEASTIHAVSLQVLEHTGVNILNEEILDLMESAGATALRSEKIAKIPPSLIEDAIPKAPSTITLYGRDDRKPFTIGKGITRSASGFDATFIQDYGSVERRPITKAEVGAFARLADRLPDIDIVGVQGIPQDVPQDKTEAHAAQMLLKNTSKHILVAPDTGRSARTMLKMVSMVTGIENIGQKPIISVHISPSAPLRWTPAACDVIHEVVRAGVPFYILPAPIAGATSPVTLAGHLGAAQLSDSDWHSDRTVDA